MNWKRFAKALVVIAAGVLTTLADMLTSGHFDLVHLRALAAFVLASIAVYLTPNAQPGTPRTAKTRIPDTQRNPKTMANQIHDNDHSKTISAIPGSYRDAAGALLSTDPTGLTPTWASSNPAVATVDPATGLIAPVLPITPGALTTISGSAANPDGSTVAYQPHDVEIIAGAPATANTQIA